MRSTVPRPAAGGSEAGHDSGAARVIAQSDGRASTDSASTDVETVDTAVRPAPGGGEMVVLGSESRYVTRAWRARDGGVELDCARENSDATENRRDEAER